ncbi:MAG: helix-turn-helix domain-containing protein, partial [Chitinophagaceae bacterium]
MRIVADKKPSLGIGFYSIPDVAHILNLNPSFVRRWLKEYWGSRFKAGKDSPSSQGVGREKAIYFHTLIEFYVFYQLRKYGLST